MKTNDQYYLLYDDGCPLCKWYTQKFVDCGFITPEARLPYASGAQQPELQFDRDLARNKIALVNASSGETLYGTDSLLQVLGDRFPLIKTVGKWKPVHFLLEQFYNFISYNRKAIAPVHVCSTNCTCEPDISYFWRVFYLVFAGLIVHTSVGFYFHRFLTPYLTVNPVADIYLYTVQFGFQFLVFKLFRKRNFYQYAGHLATVSLIGALLLAALGGIFLALQTFGINTDLFGPLGFGMVLAVMFMIHAKRTHQLGYGYLLTFTWVLFRIGIYALVFKLF